MESFAKEMGCFIDAIGNDTHTSFGVLDGLKAVIIGIAAKKLLYEYRPVKISEIEAQVYPKGCCKENFYSFFAALFILL